MGKTITLVRFSQGWILLLLFLAVCVLLQTSNANIVER